LGRTEVILPSPIPDVEELPDTDAEPLIYGERPANPGHQADRLITKATDPEHEPSERTDEYPVVGAVASAPCPDSEWLLKSQFIKPYGKIDMAVLN